MPHKTNTFARSSILMLLIGAAILVGIVLSSLFQARMTQSYFTTVVELRNARAASADMLVLLQAAETTAVFQLESRGMKDLIKRLLPSGGNRAARLSSDAERELPGALPAVHGRARHTHGTPEGDAGR